MSESLSPLGGLPGLVASNLKIAYGGHVAVENFSLAAPVGRITGLLGPNGAGKTTVFNVCSGLLRPAAGSISLFGTDVTRWSPARRARAGLGRTFQRMELCEAMTVRENIAIGLEARRAGGNLLGHVFGTRPQKRAIGQATDEALEICGLGPVAERGLATLSTGQRRLVELARCLAGGFRMLLLDEPSSGLDDEETGCFGEILRSVVREGDRGILLVEHDMALVMAVCEHLFVLDFGVLIFAGSPEETTSSEVVRAAYLGEAEPVAIAAAAALEGKPQTGEEGFGAP